MAGSGQTGLVGARAAEMHGMSTDALELGLDRTIEVLQQLLAERFDMPQGSQGVRVDDPLFAVGRGLSSLEGIEFLCEVEKEFGVRIDDLEWWVYETPTVSSVAQYLIDLSKKQHPEH